MSENIYEQTIDEQLDDLTVTCSVHGELENDDLAVRMDGMIVCSYCTLNQEMDVHNERDIDATINLSF